MIDEIIFEDVGLSFGGREIFKRVSLKIKAGRVIGIVGQNGAGKSTFLKLAAKIIQPDTGEIKIHDEKFLSRAEILHRVAAVTPEMKIYDDLTAEENLNFFSRLRGKILTAEKIFELGGRVGLDFEIFGRERVKNFSTGMRQRLKFLILLSVDAEILLLDEPTANLDDAGKKIFLAEIKNAAQSGKTVLLATNDKLDAEACDEIIKLPII